MGKCKYYWLQPKRVVNKYEFASGQDRSLKFKVGDEDGESVLQ